MARNHREDALVKVILLQRQMIDDFRVLNNQFRTALETLCGLDQEFRDIYFARVLASDSRSLPEPIPDRAALTEALESIGWTPNAPEQLSWWCSLHNHTPNPWDQAAHLRRE